MNYHGLKFAEEGTEQVYTTLRPLLQCDKEPTVVFSPISSIGSKDGKSYAKADDRYVKAVDHAVEEYQRALPRGSGFFDPSSLVKVIGLQIMISTKAEQGFISSLMTRLHLLQLYQFP